MYTCTYFKLCCCFLVDKSYRWLQKVVKNAPFHLQTKIARYYSRHVVRLQSDDSYRHAQRENKGRFRARPINQRICLHFRSQLIIMQETRNSHAPRRARKYCRLLGLPCHSILTSLT
jgi:hypothetical protein